MTRLAVSLLGKFRAERDNKQLDGLEAGKVKELLSYLLIHRGRPQSRDRLAELLWNNQPPAISRKYLRQTLWKLKCALEDGCKQEPSFLQTETEWIQLNSSADCWLDIVEFERVFNLANPKRASQLSANDTEAIQYALALYTGDLLEGWYQDWFIFERERFQMMHLLLLDKSIQHCEIHQNYDAGLAYGAEILRRDRAYERTHRQIMRLYYMSGDRTQALHQYERCAAALREELDVEPSDRTKSLYEQIRTDTFKSPWFGFDKVSPGLTETNPKAIEILLRLEKVYDLLNRIEVQIKQEIGTLDGTLSVRK